MTVWVLCKVFNAHCCAMHVSTIQEVNEVEQERAPSPFLITFVTFYDLNDCNEYLQSLCKGFGSTNV